MKRLICCLLAVATLMVASPLSAAPDRYEKQGATVWVKDEMNRLKKTLALLKRVKDERSAAKASKVLLDMYGRAGESTAMGEVGAPEIPKGEAVAAAVARNAPRIEALEQAVAEQCTRIEALELESADLATALAALKRQPAITGADFSVPEEEQSEGQPEEKPGKPEKGEKP